MHRSSTLSIGNISKSICDRISYSWEIWNSSAHLSISIGITNILLGPTRPVGATLGTFTNSFFRLFDQVAKASHLTTITIISLRVYQAYLEFEVRLLVYLAAHLSAYSPAHSHSIGYLLVYWSSKSNTSQITLVDLHLLRDWKVCSRKRCILACQSLLDICLLEVENQTSPETEKVIVERIVADV